MAKPRATPSSGRDHHEKNGVLMEEELEDETDDEEDEQMPQSAEQLLHVSVPLQIPSPQYGATDELDELEMGRASAAGVDNTPQERMKAVAETVRRRCNMS